LELNQEIKFNLPYIAGYEDKYIRDVMDRRHLAGKGHYTKLCTHFMKEEFGFKNCLLTPSCSDALEMSAILAEVGPDDEVIIPAYTFVSTANAFVLRGAKIKYADSGTHHPNVSLQSIEAVVNSATKVVVVVHYGGYPCEIEEISRFCKSRNILLIEDAACAIDSSLNGRYVGSFGDMSTFSFHETKNITCGKGGMLVINNEKYLKRALIIWEKGTNRSAFFKGEVDKYGWVDLGSSYLNSELMASFLFAQLEHLQEVRWKRQSLWNAYHEGLSTLDIDSSEIPEGNSYNYHMFYLLMRDEQDRDKVIAALKQEGIQAVFHYQSLNRSQFSLAHFGIQDCPNAQRFEETIIRLPMHYWLEVSDIKKVTESVEKNYEKIL
jgi:dTDP-4-amino-4,6-dideoxygalactose transaminase